jgi:hypothetical protein
MKKPPWLTEEFVGFAELVRGTGVARQLARRGESRLTIGG